MQNRQAVNKNAEAKRKAVSPRLPLSLKKPEHMEGDART
jgi:hypothetical protein